VEYTEAMKLEITQDKLVDLLMHAATREDIAATKKELKEDIAATRKELREEILGVKNELKEEINKLNLRMDKSDSKNDRILWFIILSMLVHIFLHVFHV